MLDSIMPSWLGAQHVLMAKIHNRRPTHRAMQRRAYVGVVFCRNSHPSAATTGLDCRRAYCQGMVRGETAVVAVDNEYKLIALALQMSPWSDFH